MAALRAAQLGAQVTLVEAGPIGGVCLNVGCIPTKALLWSAEVYRQALDASRFGVRTGDVWADWPAMQQRKVEAVHKLVSGVRMLLDRAGVNIVAGRATFSGPHSIRVTTSSGEQEITAGRFVIATGSSPMRLPVPGLDLPGVLDSTGALGLTDLPASMIIVGGGAVGLEFATLFSTLGVKVTIVEMLPRLAPLTDADIGQALRAALAGQGVKVHVGTRLLYVEKAPDGLLARLAGPEGETAVAAQILLSAAGRAPNTSGLGLEAAGVAFDRKGIQVDHHMRTSLGHIYAVGDVTGGSMLAHVASQQGEVAEENALGRNSVYRGGAVPACIFTRPEVACVGLTEQEARDKGYDVRVGRFPFNGNGQAIAHGELEGFVKIVSEAKYGAVLGMHVVGLHASDLVLEGGLGLTLETTLDELAATVHPHPALGEVVREAALAALGRPLHQPGSR